MKGFLQLCRDDRGQDIAEYAVNAGCDPGAGDWYYPAGRFEREQCLSHLLPVRFSRSLVHTQESPSPEGRCSSLRRADVPPPRRIWLIGRSQSGISLRLLMRICISGRRSDSHKILTRKQEDCLAIPNER
jgi:hypothetical protein